MLHTRELRGLIRRLFVLMVGAGYLLRVLYKDENYAQLLSVACVCIGIKRTPEHGSSAVHPSPQRGDWQCLREAALSYAYACTSFGPLDLDASMHSIWNARAKSRKWCKMLASSGPANVDNAQNRARNARGAPMSAVRAIERGP